jgi:hypothetical protein
MQEINAESEALPRFVKVMADHTSTGLWDSQGVSEETSFVPMSAPLLARLGAWCVWYETNEDYKSPDERRAEFDYAGFSAEGLAIAKAIKAELPDWTVVYFDEAKMRQHMEGGPKERSFFEYEIAEG